MVNIMMHLLRYDYTTFEMPQTLSYIFNDVINSLKSDNIEFL